MMDDSVKGALTSNKGSQNFDSLLEKFHNNPIDFDQIDNNNGSQFQRQTVDYQENQIKRHNNQNIIAETMKNASAEELSFQIESNIQTNNNKNVFFMKNLITGEITVIQDHENLDKLNDQYHKFNEENNVPKKRVTHQWTDYKEILKKNNEKLFDYVEDNDYENVKKFLDNPFDFPVDINAKGLGNMTPLHYAVNENFFDLCQLLLEKGAQPDLKTKMKRTPLHIACIKGEINLIMLLLNRKINIDEQDIDGQSALHYASERGHFECVNLLLDTNVNCHLRNKFGQTAYDIAATSEIQELFKKKKGFSSAEEYSRFLIGNKILSNSRVDHVSKILYDTFKMARLKELIKEDEIEKQHKTELNKMKNIVIENFEKMNKNTESKEVVGPHSFLILCLLGKGSFGEVYLVEKIDTHKLYAMKVLKKDKILNDNLIKYAKTERNVLRYMNNPFIVNLYYAFQTANKLYLVVKYCPGGDLGKVIGKKKKLSEDVAKIYLSEILLGLEELHRNSIVFRDLKPENVVIDEDGHALLTDFGLSKEGVNTNIARSFCGSIAYLAPEMIKRSGHNRTVDYYLFGVLMYEMLVGIPPYFSPNKDQLFDNIISGSLRVPKELSDESKSLLKGLLHRNPELRLGSKNGVEDIKSHPFFRDIVWEDVLNKKLVPPPCEKRLSAKGYLNMKITDAKNNEKKKIPDWSFFGNIDHSRPDIAN